VGTGLVSILLLGAALGIGSHSLSLLFSVLAETALSVPAGPLQTFLLNLTAVVHNVPAIGHIAHSHAHAPLALDPNAAWFAAVSIVAKEWLFRITRKVAEQESSPVLLANAYHHRSDAYSSVVALVAILGSGWFPALPLDPLGGNVLEGGRSLVFIVLTFYDRSFGFCRHLSPRPFDIQGCLSGYDRCQRSQTSFTGVVSFLRQTSGRPAS